MNAQVHDEAARRRYEARVDEELAGFVEYRLHGDAITFTHTEVLPAHEGQGVGSTLAQSVLDDARSRGLAVEPLCPFIARYIRRHPDYADLVR